MPSGPAALPDGACGPDVWAVHAGLHPQWRDLHAVADAVNDAPHDDAWLERPEVSFATRVRCCTATGERSRFDRSPADCPPPYRPWDTFYAGPALAVHGHWAWRGHYRGPHTMGLDSACVYGERLTAWKALYTATRGAAEALQLAGEIGSFDVGCCADVAVWRWASGPVASHRDALARELHERVFAWITLADERNLETVYVAGQQR